MSFPLQARFPSYPAYPFIPLVPRDKTRRLIDGVKVGRILVDLVGNPGLSGLEDGAGNAFAPSNNRIARNRFVADRILKNELLLFVIGQENRTGFCADLFQRKRFSEPRTPNFGCRIVLFTRVPLFPPVSYVQSFRNPLEVERAMIASRAYP